MSCGRAGGAARALRSPSPSWSPASPGPGSGTGDEWPRKWDRLGAVTVNHSTAPQVGLPPAGGTEPRTPGGTGILRVGRPVGTAPAAPARSPSAHLSTGKKKSLSQAKPSKLANICCPPSSPLQKHSMPFAFITTDLHFFPGAFREASGSPHSGWGVPTLPSMGRGPFTRCPNPAEPIPRAQAPS